MRTYPTHRSAWQNNFYTILSSVCIHLSPEFSCEVATSWAISVVVAIWMAVGMYGMENMNSCDQLYVIIIVPVDAVSDTS